MNKNLDNQVDDAPEDQNSEQAKFRQRNFRLQKRQELLDKKQHPYDCELVLSHSISQLREEFKTLETGEHSGKYAAIAGRVIFVRNTGKLCFATLQAGDGLTFQAMFSLAEVGEAELDDFKHFVDLGDHMAVQGEVISSKRGELSILAQKYEIVCKALHPLPILHKDLNEETRARQRYADLIVNENARQIVRARSSVVSSIRQTLESAGYIEIETPMLQTMHGGAAATPFSTHMNAFDIDLFLRISPELYLKRAMVGGIDRVFEINRNFRNEGVDSSHSPEFTMLEAYEIYSDYRGIGERTKQMIQNACKAAFGSFQVTLADGQTQDFGGNWEWIDFYEATSEAVKVKLTPETDMTTLRKIAEQGGLTRDLLKSEHLNQGKLTELIFEHFVGDHIHNPTFVFGYPAQTSPLTKPCYDDPKKSQKWDLYVRGMELATGYSELNDPVIQRNALVAQAKAATDGDVEAMQLDEDFLTALEYGMPPAGGMGMGIDRLLIALTGLGIRDTITFPLVKPTNE